MESADLVLVLVVVAIGAFAGGILFGMWLFKHIGPKAGEFIAGAVQGAKDFGSPSAAAVQTTQFDGKTVPLSGKFQPTAPNRIGWPALRRELEEDDPEAKRYEEIMKANSYINDIKYEAPLLNDFSAPVVRRENKAKETNAG